MADEVIAVDAVKAYEIVVISSLVVLSGYASSARLKRLFGGDERGKGDELPAPLEAFYRLLSRLMHCLWHPLSVVVSAVIVLIPFLYPGNIVNLAWLPRDASHLITALGVFGGVAGVFSFAYSGSDEKDSEGSRKVGPAAVRGRLESRMDSYLMVESFLADGTVAEGDDGQCLGKVSYGRRLRDMLVACIFLGLGFGAMFFAPGCFFHCFALAHSVLLVVSYLFDFFFVRRGVRLEPGVISGGVTRAGVVAFAVMLRIRPAALPESGSWHSPSPPSGWRGAPPAGARDKTPVDAYVPARPSRRGSATTPNPATHFSPAVP